MARASIVLARDPTAVRYLPARFELLKEKRARAVPFLRVLPQGTRVFGSVARGDVREASDIDLEVPHGTPSFALEVALSHVEAPRLGRKLVQATPSSVVKALWDYGEVTVSAALTPPTPLEEGFARFGGALDLAGVEASTRVPGVDKRLLLIEPTPEGHIESSVADRVGEAARKLGVPRDVVEGRIRVLRRRAASGRTGVYMTRTLDDSESPEEALASLSAADPAVRRVAAARRGGRS
jgi:predicted nucleotidyltransferase